MLMYPAALPRPTSVPVGPRKTSTCSRLNTSRLIRPSSRTLSTNRLFEALNPRMLNMSPVVLEAPPASPACIVIPGTFRSASDSVKAPCSAITLCEITWIVCGVEESGVAYLGDSTRGRWPVTSTDSRAPRTSTVTTEPVSKVAISDVPSRSPLSASSRVKTPLTPGECIIVTVSAGSLTSTEMPLAASKARSATSSGPAAISNRSSPAGRETDAACACAGVGLAASAVLIRSALVAKRRNRPFLGLRGTTGVC